MIDLTVLKGERLRRPFEISSIFPNDIIVVTSASWVLVDTKTKETVQHGSCEIDGQKLWVLCPFVQTGDYILRCTAECPPEILKCEALIRVKQEVG